MKSTDKISLFQLGTLIIIFILGTSIIITPEIDLAGRNGWITDLVATGLALAYLALLFFLDTDLKLNILEVAESCFGRWLGILIGFLYFFYFVHLGALTLRIIGDFLLTTILPGMPLGVFTFSLTLTAAYAISRGVKTIGRVGELIFPAVLFIFILLIVLAIPQYDFTNLLPIERNYREIGQATYSIWAFAFGDLIILSFLIPYLKGDGDKNSKSYVGLYLLGATFLGGLVLTFRTLVLTVVMGGELASLFTYPIFSMVGTIQVGDFLERLEVFFLVMWIGSVFVKLLLAFWSSIESLAYLSKTQEKTSFLFPVGIIMVGMAQLLFESFGEEYNFVLKSWPFYSSIFVLIIPLLVILAVSLKRLAGRGE